MSCNASVIAKNSILHFNVSGVTASIITSDNEVSFYTSPDDGNILFFRDLYFKFVNSHFKNKKDYVFDFNIDNFSFKECFIKSIQEENFNLGISLIYGFYEIIPRENLYSIVDFSSTKEKILYLFDKYSFELEPKKEKISYHLNSEEEELKEIMEEIDLYLNNNDIYFEKKLNGELKYL
jgi:hypothetical protein